MRTPPPCKHEPVEDLRSSRVTGPAPDQRHAEILTARLVGIDRQTRIPAIGFPDTFSLQDEAHFGGLGTAAGSPSGKRSDTVGEFASGLTGVAATLRDWAACALQPSAAGRPSSCDRSGSSEFANSIRSFRRQSSLLLVRGHRVRIRRRSSIETYPRGHTTSPCRTCSQGHTPSDKRRHARHPRSLQWGEARAESSSARIR
jgi:hypothetical protein